MGCWLLFIRSSTLYHTEKAAFKNINVLGSFILFNLSSQTGCWGLNFFFFLLRIVIVLV